MQCDKCRNETVLSQPYSGRHLCGRHLAADVEDRAKHAIRAHHWLTSGDHIVAAISGDRRGGALLCFLERLIAHRRDVRLSAILTGPAAAGSDPAAGTMRYAALLGIPVLAYPTLNDRATAVGNGDVPDDDTVWNSGMPCRSLQQKLAEKYKITKIAVGFSLDDIALGVLEQFLRGNAYSLAHPPGAGAISVICPFMSVPSHELDLYWDYAGNGENLPRCTPFSDCFSRDIATLLGDYYSRHPATKYALLHLGEDLSGDTVAGILTAAAGRKEPGTCSVLQEVRGNGK
jgi:hypothetical protein